jgi:hypothetical protein
MILLRGLLQPLTEREMLKHPSSLAAGLQAAESSRETDNQDPLLGVAVQAVDQDH